MESSSCGYLKGQAGFNLVCQNLGDTLVKASNNFHCQLWLDAACMDQVIESINESEADAAE